MTWFPVIIQCTFWYWCSLYFLHHSAHDMIYYNTLHMYHKQSVMYGDTWLQWAAKSHQHGKRKLEWFGVLTASCYSASMCQYFSQRLLAIFTVPATLNKLKTDPTEISKLSPNKLNGDGSLTINTERQKVRSEGNKDNSNTWNHLVSYHQHAIQKENTMTLAFMHC